jgi:hypothetical protein
LPYSKIAAGENNENITDPLWIAYAFPLEDLGDAFFPR